MALSGLIFLICEMGMLDAFITKALSSAGFLS